jgi:DNA-binding transcriptional ArsR family regulator
VRGGVCFSFLGKQVRDHRPLVAPSGYLRGPCRKLAALSLRAREPIATIMIPAIQELASLDRVIHEPARLMIMTLLYAAPEADFLYVQRECEFTQGNLSSHLAKLDEAGYVFINKMFKGKYPLTICSLTKKGRYALEEYVRSVRAACAEILGADPSTSRSALRRGRRG